MRVPAARRMDDKRRSGVGTIKVPTPTASVDPSLDIDAQALLDQKSFKPKKMWRDRRAK